MQLIVAVDKFWGIGKNNDLLFSLKEDMKFFRQTTLGKTIVMGYNTLMSFPFSKPLPKRKNIVLTSDGESLGFYEKLRFKNIDKNSGRLLRTKE